MSKRPELWFSWRCNFIILSKFFSFECVHDACEDEEQFHQSPIHSSILPSIHLSIDSFLRSSSHSFTHSFISQEGKCVQIGGHREGGEQSNYSFIQYPFICSSFLLFIFLNIHLSIRSFIYPSKGKELGVNEFRTAVSVKLARNFIIHLSTHLFISPPIYLPIH